MFLNEQQIDSLALALKEWDGRWKATEQGVMRWEDVQSALDQGLNLYEQVQSGTDTLLEQLVAHFQGLNNGQRMASVFDGFVDGWLRPAPRAVAQIKAVQSVRSLERADDYFVAVQQASEASLYSIEEVAASTYRFEHEQVHRGVTREELRNADRPRS